MAKDLKIKVRKFWGLVSMFVEVTRENLVKKQLTEVYCKKDILKNFANFTGHD